MINSSLASTLQLALLFSLVIHGRSLAQDNLAKRLDEFLAQPHFNTAHFGWLFVDLKTGEVVLERSSDKLFVPASTTKLFSTAAALDALSADYRFRTPVH